MYMQEAAARATIDRNIAAEHHLYPKNECENPRCIFYIQNNNNLYKTHRDQRHIAFILYIL